MTRIKYKKVVFFLIITVYYLNSWASNEKLFQIDNLSSFIKKSAYHALHIVRYNHNLGPNDEYREEKETDSREEKKTGRIGQAWSRRS